MTGSFDYSVQNSAQYNVQFWPIVLSGVRAALLPLKKPWFSVAVGLLAQTPTHPIGQERAVKLKLHLHRAAERRVCSQTPILHPLWAHQNRAEGDGKYR